MRLWTEKERGAHGWPLASCSLPLTREQLPQALAPSRQVSWVGPLPSAVIVFFVANSWNQVSVKGSGSPGILEVLKISPGDTFSS